MLLPSRKQASEIADGYKNLIKSKLGLSSDKDQKIFSARKEICDACENKSELNRCLKCGCPLDVKTKSLTTNCPIGLW